MRKLKKVIAASMVFGMLSCAFSVSAKKIGLGKGGQEEVFAAIRVSVVDSKSVTTKKTEADRISEILAICEKRIAGLENIILAISGKKRVKTADIAEIVGTYFRDCDIKSGSYDREGLSAFENHDELQWNVKSLQDAYRAICAEFSSRAPKTSAEKKCDGRERPEQRLDRREGRKGERRQKGHFRYR